MIVEIHFKKVLIYTMAYSNAVEFYIKLPYLFDVMPNT